MSTPVEPMVMPVKCQHGCSDRVECGCPQDCHDCNTPVFLGEGQEWPERGKIRCWECQQKLIEFLLSQFQMHSPAMNGRHSWRFRNGGWPMTHLKGPTIDAAILAAMDEIERERSDA